MILLCLAILWFVNLHQDAKFLEVWLLRSSLFALASLLAVAGCSSTIDAYQQTLKIAITVPDDVEIPLVELQARTVPVLYLRPNDRGRVALVATEIDGNSGISNWLSADERIVQLTHGRITKLQGFKPNYDFVQFSTADLIAQPLDRIRPGQTVQSTNDWSGSQLTSYLVEHEILEKTPATLNFFNQDLAVVLVKEQVSFPDGSQFINQFWFDATSGELLQSVQKASHFSPEFELIEISKIARKLNLAQAMPGAKP